MWTFTLASLAFLGVFNLLTLPLSGAVTWLLAQRKDSQRGLPGLFATASVPFFYIAYLNRQGPGYVIIHFANGSESHSQESSPFIWLGIGAVFFVIGLTVFVAKTRQERRTP
ncbi:MAG: hypothetical protein PXZ08_04105 [Actinomycetota bacterium]|jgi:membrane protease YdiL (CAAX protease family)|nr:hypothetical protein [Actinomycetota bacterium]